MLSPSEFGEYLKVAKEYKVRAFKLPDGTTVELGPDLGGGNLDGPLVEDPGTVAGAWKRGPDLTADDTEWD